MAGVFAIDSIISFGKSIVTLASNLQQAKVAFSTMLGSAEQADILLR